MIFVTGGTGLVGSHLLYDLLSAGKSVRVLKRPTSNLKGVKKVFAYYTDKADELFDQIEWVEGDILDYHSLEELLVGATEVFHCAAIVSFHPNDRDSMLNNNVKGTANLINAALHNQVKKFCHVSSIAALGKTQDGTEINEETYWIPSKQKSGYSLSKFFSEMEVWRGIEEGLEAVIVNPSIILGPGNWDIGSPKLFQAIWKGLKYYTKGETGFVDVRDVAEAVVLLIKSDVVNERFILNGENLSFKVFFSMVAAALNKRAPFLKAGNFLTEIGWRLNHTLCAIFGKAPAITKDTARAAHNKAYYSNRKFSEKFNYAFRTVDDAVKNTARWYLGNS